MPITNTLTGSSSSIRRRDARTTSDSGDQFPDDMPVDVSKAKVSAGMAEGELFVVEPEQRQNGRVQVVNVDFVFDGLEAEFVRGAMDVSAARAAAGQPHGEAVVVVIAAVDLAGVRSGCRQFHGRRAAELTPPDHQRFLQQAALLQVRQQGPNGLVGFLGEPAVVHFNVIVVVPRLPRPVPDLDEAHALFDQAPGNQQLARLGALAVHFANVFGLARDIERVGGIHLHPVSQFEGLDARFELRVLLAFLLMALVERLQQLELLVLFRQRGEVVFDVLDELLDPRVLRVDVSALENSRQETGLPVLRFLNRIAARTHHDETRQVLVLGAQTISDPGTHARPDQPRFAAVHQQQRRFVIGNVGVHRPNDRDVVHTFADAGKNLADFDAALAVLFEFVGNAAPVFRSVFKFSIGNGLPAYFSRAGLGSKVSTCEGPPLAKM